MKCFDTGLSVNLVVLIDVVLIEVVLIVFFDWWFC